MNSILAEYGLPVTALIVSIVVFVLITKRERKFRKMIERDKEFMEWRKEKKEFKKLKKKLYKYKYLRDFWLPRIGTDASSLSSFRLKKISKYEKKIEYIEQKIKKCGI